MPPSDPIRRAINPAYPGALVERNREVDSPPKSLHWALWLPDDELASRNLPWAETAGSRVGGERPRASLILLTT